jgi:hypothetical protein
MAAIPKPSALRKGRLCTCATTNVIACAVNMDWVPCICAVGVVLFGTDLVETQLTAYDCCQLLTSSHIDVTIGT